MDTYKLRMKIGTAEFEAEGSEETVRQQFEEFKALLDHPAHTSAGSSAPKENGGAQTEAPATKLKSPDVTGLDRLFAVDEKNGKKAVSLRFLPQGDDHGSTAALLILLAHEKLVGEESVRVTALKEDLERSGLTLSRVDRLVEKPRRQGLLLKGGKAKGGTYALSNTGRIRAAEELKKLLEQVE